MPELTATYSCSTEYFQGKRLRLPSGVVTYTIEMHAADYQTIVLYFADGRAERRFLQTYDDMIFPNTLSMTQPMRHAEVIRCPRCKRLQAAIVEQTVPCPTYLHICDCGRMIMESEWEKVID